jgi:hypothetical protein
MGAGTAGFDKERKTTPLKYDYSIDVQPAKELFLCATSETESTAG